MRIGFIVVFVFIAVGCKKKHIEIKELSSEEYVVFRQPAHFPSTVYPIHERPVETEKFNLGRELFYSTVLSSDNTISCASCHAQPHAFADHNIAMSVGVGGALGTRNAPAIFNLAWQPAFMWDGGVNHLEMFSIAPITNELEMNETIPNVLAKLNASQAWKTKFKKAFGVDHITDYEIYIALTQYMLMIISDNAHYDKVVRGEATFTIDQQEGYTIFQNKCASCHQEPLFTDYSYRNNGLDEVSVDDGRFLITQQVGDKGKFKVPTLRNVLLTYPYMHDGRFTNIDQVFEHYNSGVKNHANLDPSLSNGISLDSEERKYLKAFLATLVDYELLDNKLLAP